LHHRDIFYQQLRAILRAAVGAKTVQIMFPFISSLDEFYEARQAVYDCMRSLESENLIYHQQPLIGVLVELPSIVEIIDELAAVVDFLSIGTNDFVQYMLAVDRANEKVVHYYQPYHPAVLRSLTKIVRAANKQSKKISVCGELAHEKDFIPFFLGIGIRVLSVYPKFLPCVQNIISNLKISEAEEYTQRLLSEVTIQGVRRAIDEFRKSYPAI
jgi:phosphotransferase system enzyme I (PtsP)